ncbi:MAG: autotransporter outer membrane beta-barrel domain-containing protein [Elusimicrobiota bacterium]|jgi:hypothetical protein|nr:autotransporter outer membrane beta-barrel domain-containing protein [Elusimicrobiota bacterium]
MKKLIIISIVFISVLFYSAAHARQSITIKTPDGLKDLFVFDIADAGETFSRGSSQWTLLPEQIAAINISGQYWSSLLGNLQKNTQPVSLSFGTYNMINDDSLSQFGEHGFGMTELAVAVTSNEFRDFNPYNYDGQEHKAYASIRIGFVSAPNVDYTGGMKILPDNGNNASMASVILHEIGHAFGITSNSLAGRRGIFIEYASGSGELSIFDKHLVDSFGNPSGVNMDITENAAAQGGEFHIIPAGDASLNNPDIGGYAFFQGANVRDALLGKGFGVPVLSFNNPNSIEGVPILGFENSNPDLSHIELRNSMMSHQKYRNWNIYMEAELALLQDIGLVIDRRNFYGLSIYADNDNITLDDFISGYLLFYARKINAGQEWEYDIGKYNETPWTIAFHIYGSTNNVVISSGNTALSKGYSSIGIRIDGWANKLNIENGAVFRADGEGGIGLLVSYGKNQMISLDGIISANGQDGIGARFDFGDNMMGNSREYRGSYIRGKTDSLGNWDTDMPLLDELKGAMVSSFTISGTLEGQKAAIYISKNAFVDRIFILNGAKISGDIISDWNPNADFTQNIAGVDKNKLKTNLFLGVSIESDNVLPNPSFSLAYDGDIKAQKAFNVSLFGGDFIYGGKMSGLSSFYAGGLSSFTVNVKNKSSISAEKIVFEPFSNLVVRFDEDFIYGNQTVFNLFSQNISFNQDNVEFISKETVSAGFYDNVHPEIRLNQNGSGIAFDLVLNKTADTVLSKERAASGAIGAPLFLSIADKGADAVFEREKLQNFGFWIKPQYAYTWSGSDYSINSPSLTFGLDKSFKNYFFGAALHFAKPTYKSNAADIDENKASAFIYGGLNLPSEIDLMLLAGAGNSKYSQIRSAQGLQNYADFNGQSYDLGFKLSRPFSIGQILSFQPFISYEYLSANAEGFEESGSFLALKFKKSQFETNRFKIGTAFQNILSNKIKLNSKIFYMGLFGDISAKNEISFIEAKNISTIGESGQLSAHYFGCGANN